MTAWVLMNETQVFLQFIDSAKGGSVEKSPSKDMKNIFFQL